MRIANIGPQERRKRLTRVMLAFGLSIGLGLILITSDLSRPWRALLFVPLWLAALGVFQARDKT